MHDARASETLAYRVLEQWCLVGEEPMEGEQWETMCELAGADPTLTSEGAMYLRSVMTPEQRQARLRELNYQRQIAFRKFDNAA